MIVDSSAVLAILLREPERYLFEDAILASDSNKISAVNFVEAAVVADAREGAGLSQFDALLREFQVEISPVTAQQAYSARQAYMDYGKGRHPAGLNLGDCFAYALAKVSNEPLLFKGNDFRKTDVESAL